MPNIRLRRAPVGTSPTSLILRPLRAIGALTKAGGGAILPQAEVRAFNTLTDVLVSKDVSDSLGRYGTPVLDGAAYYTVGIQDGTWDSPTVTFDNTGVTFDRANSVGGVSANSLLGSL